MNAAHSDQRRGWIVTNEDPAHYYFGPQLALANLDGGDIEESFDVSQDDSNADAPALVAYRVSGTGAFCCESSLAFCQKHTVLHALSLVPDRTPRPQPRFMCCSRCKPFRWTRTRCA